MTATTTLSFTKDQLYALLNSYVLLNSLEGEWTDHMTEEELQQHEQIHAQIVNAINRFF